MPRPLPTRRAALQGACAAAAAATQAPRALAAAAPRPTARDLELALFERATFGYTADDFAELEARGPERWLHWQLEPELIDDSALEARLAPFDWRQMSAAQMDVHPTLEDWDIAHEGRAVRLLRAVYSRRQLFERVVEFWTDHFNIYGSADDTWLLKLVDDRDVIRAHALGRFRELLQASARSPAMLAYLDNDTNVVGAAQENYAREVMELHTLGVDGPYTEADVREVARCFTGWGFIKPWQPGETGTFIYRPADHDDGQKTVLGMSLPPGGGMADGTQVLDMLASHPDTVDHVTRKLARWFLGYAPPEVLVERAKARWVATDGDIREVVRTLLGWRLFTRARPLENRKLKRPFHWIASLYRATGVDLDEPRSTIWQIWGIGQVPYQWRAPNGYPDTEGAWASGLVQRWSQAAFFCNGWYWSTSHTIDHMRALLGGAPKSQWARVVSQVLSGGAMDPYEVARIQDHLDTFSSESNQAVGEAFELCASAPSYQRY